RDRARLQRVVEDAGTESPDGHAGLGNGGFPGIARAPAARTRVRGRRRDLRTVYRGEGPEPGDARVAASADRTIESGAPAGVYFRQQSTGRECADDDTVGRGPGSRSVDYCTQEDFRM